MNHRLYFLRAHFAILIILLAAPRSASAAELKPKTSEAWNSYIQLTEKRIASELDGQRGFLLRDFRSGPDAARIRSVLKGGQIYIEKTPLRDAKNNEFEVEDGIIHHWYGSIFIPEMTAARLLKWVQEYDQHHRFFPEVEKSRLVSRDRNTFRIYLRLVRTKILTVLTVHYNTEHTVTFRQHDPGRTSSQSVSTRIAQIDDPGKPNEKEMAIGKDSGYFWRTNSYWRYREEDGGVFVECESISLSRGIPFGLGLLLKGYVESVPRESLEGLLMSIRAGATSAGNAPGRD
jgi:hypothetical protein